MQYYVNAKTGQPDAPSYVRWWQFTKVGLNIATAVLAWWAILDVWGQVSSNASVEAFFILATLLRLLEVAKDVVPLVRRRKDLTVQDEHQPFVTVFWVKRCCARREGAEAADKWLKYASSVLLSGALCGLAAAALRHRANFGAALTALAAAADCGLGAFVFLKDDSGCWKDYSRMRLRPDMDLGDDELAEDASVQAPIFRGQYAGPMGAAAAAADSPWGLEAAAPHALSVKEAGRRTAASDSGAPLTLHVAAR